MESLSNHKRLRTESKEEKMIPEQFGIVKILLKQFTDNYRKVTEALKNAHRKWNTAIIALWYPLISRRKNETIRRISN